MAWRAELKRRNWYCILEMNMVQIFSKHIYDEWYNSLTDEEKIEIDRAEAEYERNRRKKLNTSLAKLMLIPSLFPNMYNNDKYNGIYDEYGFPKK